MNGAAILGLVGTIVGMTRALPQLLGFFRSGKANGVSPDSAATSSLVSVGGAVYGIMTHQMFLGLSASTSALIFVLITILSIRFGRSVAELRVAPVWLIVMIVCWFAFGVTGLGMMIPVSVLASNTPQVMVAYRESNLSDLSLSTWALNFSDGLVWSGYSLIQDDNFLLLYGAFQMATSSAIIFFKLTKRYRSKHYPMPS